ncbi:MAG: ATP-binding cassette domain-containing protein [Clostridiales bacterium]|nr:ATP-binding cassette domain-containing protein [Clostridiales bacterium]
MEDYFLKLISAEKSYGETKILKDISIGLHKGRTVGLLGEKGAGKTTLCKLICGIERQTEGKILFDGKKIKKDTKKRIRFLLSEDDISKFKTISEIFDFYETFYPDFSRKKAIDLMRTLGMDTEQKIANNKGINQLTALCVLGSGSADLYVLDEPLNYYDRSERAFYLKEVFRTFETHPLIIISTEILRGIEPLLDDVVFMHEGRVKLCKSVEEIRIRTGKGAEDFYKEVYGFGNL